MKPIHLNLASKPFRDYRLVYAVVGIAFALSAILLIVNTRAGYQYFVSTRETRDEIAAIESAARTERANAKQVEAGVQQFDTRLLAAETSFINDKIAERAFSWTEMLDTLERVVPRNVRLVSLNPTVGRDGKTNLSMQCVAKDEDGMVELLNRLFAHEKFSNPFPSSEARGETGEYRFQISVQYDQRLGRIE